MPVQSPKRGAIPSPRSTLAGAAPHVAGIGAPPNHITKPQQISWWGNNAYKDCVTAEEAFAKTCNNPEIFIPDAEAIAWATSHGVLNGAALPPVMTFMQDDGFADGSAIYDDGPYLSVNWEDAGTLQSAISEGPVKLGVAADQLAIAVTCGQSGWFATGFHTDAKMDHCVALCGYGSISWLAQQLGVKVPAGVDGTQPGYAMFTWDSIGIIDVPSMIAITTEAWLRQPTTRTQFSAPSIFVRPNGEADIVVQGPNNSLMYYHATPGSGWTASEVAPAGTTFSAPSIYVRSTDPVGEADIVAQGPNNSLMYYFATPGSGWDAIEVAPAGTTYSAPSIDVRSTDPVGEADIVAQGPNNSLKYYYSTPGTPFAAVQVAG